MDIELARTFLTIVETGSFVRAAERLNVTQTTVSARVRSLEDQLRRPVFVRNKSGSTLTPAGEQFQPFARTLVQVWERARVTKSPFLPGDAPCSLSAASSASGARSSSTGWYG